MKIRCDKCGGTGLVRDKLEIVATMGISLLFDLFVPTEIGKEVCPKCKGKKFIKYIKS